jgi:hypothetical protein
MVSRERLRHEIIFPAGQLLVARTAFVTLCAMQKIFLALGFWFTLAVSVFGAEIKIDFSDFSAGSTPTNFHRALAGGGSPGDWKIVMDEVPPLLAPLSDKALNVTRRAVLAQTGTDMTDERFPMFIYDGEIFKDFNFSTRFKIVGGITEQMAGVVFRFQNASNFYVVRASALGRNVRFYKVVDGIRADPIGPQLDITNNVWHTLSVGCQGNQLTFWFDGRLVMPPLQDNTFAVGKVGFWTKSDAVSYFSDPVIDYTPRIPVAQTLVADIMEKQPRILGLRIYALNDQGQPHIIASKDENEVGQPGTDAEKNAITDSAISYGREKGTDTIVLPFRDRNGDPMAAVHVKLKSFIGETQANALVRANMVVKSMQAEVTSSEQLMQ